MLSIVPSKQDSPPDLWSMKVREKSAHGGGLCPVEAGELHTPAVWEVLTCHGRMRNGNNSTTLSVTSYKEPSMQVLLL